MAKARQAAKARSESQYVIAPTATGPVLGQVVQESATGVVTLRVPDGSTVECTLEGRLIPSADPTTFGRVPFDAPTAEDLTARLEALLGLYRDERKTADERRDWAAAHGGRDLPEGKDVDELLKYRYEQHRGDWAASLRTLLSDAARDGNDRPLLAALDQSVPTDARRVAAGVAVELRADAAVPALCAAAIHKTQAAFGRDAVRALQALAPERLGLIANAAQPDVVAAIDRDRLAQSPEAEFLANKESAGVSDAAASPELRGETLLHLALALPLAEQLRVWGATGNAAAIDSLRGALRDAYHAIGEKESPTAYELLLRTALAQLILADSSDSILSALRGPAARVLARDVDAERLGSLISGLPESAAGLLARTGVSSARGERLEAVLVSVADQRPALAPKLGPAVRAALTSGEMDPARRLTALRVLAADPESHGALSREAERELGRDAGRDAEQLAISLVRNEVPLQYARVRAAGRAELLRALPSGSSRYAASALRAIREGDAAETWAVLNGLTFPGTWFADREFRQALLEWLEPASATSVSSPIIAAFLTVLADDAPTQWTSWQASRRAAALAMLAKAPVADSAPVVARIAIQLAAHDPLRTELLTFAAGALIANSPDALALIAPQLPEEELRLALLAQGAELDRRIADWRTADQQQHRAAARRLADDLRAELNRSLHALGRDDQLGILFSRLSEDVASLSPQEGERDPEVAAFEQDFPSDADGCVTDWGEALVAALRRIGGRSRSSQAAISFFRDRITTLLESRRKEELEGFVTERRRVLDRLDLAAIEPLAAALLKAGSAPSFVQELFGSAADSRSAINVALRVGGTHQEAALRLLGQFQVDLQSMADALATRSTEWHELTDNRNRVVGGVMDLARRLAPTLDAIEGLFLNYMRVRRILMQHGLAPVEPVLGNTRDARELVPGTHRVIGLSIADGTYEVLTLGLRTAAGGEVVVPATVARRANEELESPDDPP